MLIRRRIPRIIICDGSADPNYQFEGISDLTRKARIDLDACIQPFSAADLAVHVPQSLHGLVGTPEELQPVRDANGNPVGPSKKHAALYWIDYRTEPSRRSVLLYLKATVTGDENSDIENYHATHPEFPHESTGDQVFVEAQWESYRNLGHHIGYPLFEDQSWLWKIPLVSPGGQRCC